MPRRAVSGAKPVSGGHSLWQRHAGRYQAGSRDLQTDTSDFGDVNDLVGFKSFISISNIMRNLQVVVIGDAQADKEKFDFCEQLGHYLGEKGYTVITGGRSGVMEAVNKGAYKAGGITVGILPSTNLEDANPWCRVVIPTDLGHGRNIITALSADVVISIGGKAGTLTELGFAWIYNKPIISFTQFGGWSETLSNQMIDDRRADNIIAVDSMDALKIQLESIANRIKKR